METNNFTLKDREWQYKGEGNAHLAISLPQDQLVLRLEKVPHDSPIDDNTYSPKIELEVDFVKIVMTKLLGKSFVAPPQIVYLSREEIDNLNKLLLHVRPESRRHKKIGRCSATLWSDLCFLPRNLCNPSLPIFSVEIKPKQGVFAPTDQGTQPCLFCSKQDLKLKTNSVFERSNYCPLNLFSGDREKMMDALKGLLHTPQNNFAIYKNGKPVFGPECLNTILQDILSEWLQPVKGTALEDRICGILVDVLTKKIDPESETVKDELVWQDDGPPLLCRLADSAKRPFYVDSPEANGRRQCYWGKQNLPSGCVLQKLAAVQSLGVCGHAAAYELYKQEVNLGADNYTYVKNILDAGCSSALSPLQSYLVSALARDCSIMIAFQRVQDGSQQVAAPVVADPGTGASYIFQIRLMDLDPKPLSCVETHHKRNYEIAQARKK